MGYNSVVSGYPISTSFPQVDSLSTNPWVLGYHTQTRVNEVITWLKPIENARSYAFWKKFFTLTP